MKKHSLKIERTSGKKIFEFVNKLGAKISTYVSELINSKHRKEKSTFQMIIKGELILSVSKITITPIASAQNNQQRSRNNSQNVIPKTSANGLSHHTPFDTFNK